MNSEECKHQNKFKGICLALKSTENEASEI